MPEAKESSPDRMRFERVGLQRRLFSDAYHFVLVASWWRFFGLIGLAYAAVSALFAIGFVVPGQLESRGRVSYADAFFFSVQTLASVGFGKLTPATTVANVLVTFESLVGILGVALVTGITFAKFARPTARVLFSDVAVVSPRDGVPSLMVRIANERASQIVDVNLFMVLSLNDVTSEGESVRRFHTLSLSRPRAATFALTWTTIHPIDDASPLRGLTADDLLARRGEVILIVTGIDETFAQTVHARTNYSAQQIRFGHRFADILRDIGSNHRLVDYAKFHDTLEVE